VTDVDTAVHQMRLRPSAGGWVAECSCEQFRTRRQEFKGWAETAWQAHAKVKGDDQ